MSANLPAAATFHSDHRHWQSDIHCWKDDIENWRAEHSHAIVQLQAALRRINENAQCLDDHAESVASLESSLEYHERNLAASLSNNSHTELDETLESHHRQEADLYQRQRDAHERMKRHHHQAMAKVAMMAKAFEETC